MPIYTVQVADGRQIDIESPDPDTARADAEGFARSNPRGASAGKTYPTTPGAIAGGPGALDTRDAGTHGAPDPQASINGVPVTPLGPIDYSTPENQRRLAMAAAESPELYKPGGYQGGPAALSPGARAAYAKFQKGFDQGGQAGFAYEPKWLQGFSEHLGNGMSFGNAGTLVGAEAAAGQGMSNFVGGMFGQKPEYSMADAYAGFKQAQNDKMHSYDGNPLANGTGEVIGMWKSPFMGRVNNAMAAPSVAARAVPGSGFAANATRAGIAGLEQTAKSATVGAGYGALSGAGAARPGQEAQDAQQGAKTGAVLGAIAPVAGRIGGAVINSTVAPTARAVVRLANRAGAQATGTAGFLNPNLTAQARVAEALRADGVKPETIQQVMSDWTTNGSPTPLLLDAAGNTTRRLLRIAASKSGPASQAAQRFASQSRADLIPGALKRTNALLDDPRTAPDAAAQITAQRRTDADAMYAAPYAQPVDPAPVLDAVGGDAGRMATNSAYKTADARRQYEQQNELQSILEKAPADPAAQADAATTGLSATPNPNDRFAIPGGPVTLGSLHRIKVAFDTAAEKAAETGNAALARGYADRAGDIDRHLASVSPDYAAARDTYAQHSRMLDALKSGDINIVNTDPAAFARVVATMSPEERQMAALQVRQNLLTDLGGVKEGAVGRLNSISTAGNAKQNLALLLGPDAAASYQSALHNMSNRVGAADFVAPDTGSKTVGVALDAAAENIPHIPHTKAGLIAAALNKLRSGVTMTDAERQAIVELGQTQLDSLPKAAQKQADKPLTPRLVPAVATASGRNDQ